VPSCTTRFDAWYARKASTDRSTVFDSGFSTKTSLPAAMASISI
jgi:hypothetical protein